MPRLTVSRSAGVDTGLAMSDFRWRGLSLRVAFEQLPDGATVELRTSAGDAATSIAERASVTSKPGHFMLLVADDDLEGEQAQLVVVGADTSILFQRTTTVGQNR